MKKSSTIRSTIAAALAAISFAAFAMPVEIAYQGVLRDSHGNAVTPLQQTVEFRLYTTPAGDTGEALWGRSVAVLLDQNGLFNVSLSDDNGALIGVARHEMLADALKTARSSSLYIGITVLGSSGEISPRQQLLPVPYSTYAKDVDSASGDFTVSGTATVSGLKVNQSSTFEGDARFKREVTVERKLTVNGGLKVASGGVLEGYGTIPVGGIIMWSGRTVPDGWTLCNGENGTPNLRDRFVMGGTTSQVGATGGKSSVTLEWKHIPPHRHEYYGDDQLEGRDWNSTQVSRWVGGYDAESKLKGSGKVYWTSYSGGGESFDARPPYYVLAFIMRVK